MSLDRPSLSLSVDYYALDLFSNGLSLFLQEWWGAETYARTSESSERLLIDSIVQSLLRYYNTQSRTCFRPSRPFPFVAATASSSS